MLHTNNKLYWLYSLLIFLTLYTDSPLSTYLGAFGESMLPSISLCLYILFALTNRINRTDSFVRKSFVCDHVQELSFKTWKYISII